MKRYLENRITLQLLSISLAAGIALPLTSLAASVALVTQPMATTTASNVKPNIMFILDDSGSMASDYLPDWANTGTANLHQNASYNGIYYNPAVTYSPPVYYNADGSLNSTTYPSQIGQAAATGADATTKPNWKSVKYDAYGILTTATVNLVGNSSFYTIVPGEYCATLDLKSCVAQAVPTVANPYPAPLRWCSSSANASAAIPAAGSCQAIRISPYTNARYPQPKTTTITVGGAGSTSVSSITVGGLVIAAPVAASTSTSTLATSIRDAINTCSATTIAPCTTSGFSATVSGSTVTVIANAPGAFAAPVFTPTGTMTFTVGTFTGGNSVPGSNRYNNIIPTLNSYPYPGTTTKATSRTDCTGTTCTFLEEMINYANWLTYYQTRIQSMKSSVSRAFKAMDSRFRIGYSTISDTGTTNGATFLGVNTFELAHKNTWFNMLFAADAWTYTPLRGAISKAGRYYANRYTGQVDPIQYSCQQNFTILSTDGYWNTNTETSAYGPYGLTGASVGNLDGGTTPRPLKEGTTAESNTLADVAKYYYDTDLRTSALGNCAGASSIDFPLGNPDVCVNNVFTSSTDSNVQQHMTTFTMGLGADGYLNFTTDYDTATSGDFHDLTLGTGNPTVNWPDPITNSAEARIDDLWHAAVNGRGLYFSAKSPDQIVAGFTKALSSITATIGSAAAAATSTLTPVAGNNFAYVASYTTSIWKGNLEARTIDLATGSVNKTATWCVENVLAGTCATTPVPHYSVSGTTYTCDISGATAATCTAGVLNGSTCSTPMAIGCTGTMAAKVGATSDTRTIYTANPAGAGLVAFDAAFATAYPANFAAAHVNALNQWSSISGQYTATKLINYLRGQTGYEKRASNAAADQLFRARETTLGDILESQPAYISAPVFDYSDPTYIAYKAAQAGRAGTVYMGANDGMLHAIDALTGVERWAYVPSMVIPNMWKLASDDYGTNHVNFINGSPVISDIYGAGGWRTILVGGLNGGGRGYYALDITDPVTPTLLWEFTPSKAAPNGDVDLGYSFGQPVVTSKADGTWVVLVTSGYDNGTLSATPVTPPTVPVTFIPNAPTGSGVGNLYVLSASTGAIISKIPTGAGSLATPSGLAQIVAWNNTPAGNQAGNVYGGDLLGNLWRFDITAGTASLFATLSDGTTGQPITTTPVLGLVSNKHVVFVGTGKYLETSDLSNKQVQSFYAIKDDGTAVGSPRSHTGATDRMVQQTISAAGNMRTGTKNTVDFNNDRGWFEDFPDVSTGSERVNIDPQLVSGTLIVPTIVPSSTACSPGGYSWLSYLDYRNGGPVGTGNFNISLKFDSSIVGVNVILIQNKPVVEVITAADPTPSVPSWTPPFNSTSFDFSNQRSIWRELP
jgi:type IV pilus assembly protein PilY1